MPVEQPIANRVRDRRIACGWSQGVLAAKAGISRAGLSAIETSRLVPSTSAALALATALDCRVEDLFQLAAAEDGPIDWAWKPETDPARFWRASIAGRELLYPVEPTNMGTVAHDGVYRQGHLHERDKVTAADTLIMASCDPVVGLLATELTRRFGVRLIALQRSSREAIRLLSQGLVHVAGVHLAKAGRREENAAAVRDRLSQPFCLLHGARWQEGLASAPGLQLHDVHSVLQSRVRWVGREPGSAVRQLLDTLLAGRRPPRRIANGHRGVAEAIRSGWGDVGICLRLASEEAGLNFLSIHEEEYDFVYPAQLESDPRLQALVNAVRSPSYRNLLSETPGYNTTNTGDLQRIACS